MGVDLDAVWGITQAGVPELKRQVQSIMAEMKEPRSTD